MQPDFLSRFLNGKQSLYAVAAGVLVLVCLLRLGNSLYEDILLARATPDAAATIHRVSSSAPPAPGVEVLVQAQFFGATSTAATAQAAHSAQAPETRLSLQLQGVMGSTVAEAARALIAQKGQRAKYYGIKDTLPGGASIHKIEASQVILSRNGMLETLSFPKPQTSPDTPAYADASDETQPSAADGSSSPFQQLHESQVADQADPQPLPSEAPPEVPSQTSLSIKERLKQLRESRNL